jgi:hypothetical protein
MEPELVGVQGDAHKAQTYRRPQEWTSSVVQRRTFTAVRLWPPEDTSAVSEQVSEVHLAAAGAAERELQAVAKQALIPPPQRSSTPV